jgi:putative ABC transport system ATP-binding protein
VINSKKTMITLENICKSYHLGGLAYPILQDICLRIETSDYTAIMGASGSGKSTLMNILGCLDRATSGQYRMDDQDLSTFSNDQLADLRNQTIGFVFQQFNLLPRLTALENVMLPLVYAGVAKAERYTYATTALTQVGLAERLGNLPSQLSGGQQQRVAIARALVNQPALLLADEPTGALDSQTSQEVMQLFTDLNHQGITIVIITHAAEIAAQTKRTVCLQDGRIMG